MDNNIISPILILGVESVERINVENFFMDYNNPLKKLLEEPPYLRYSGWNLRTLDRPRIVEGKCWEVKNGERKTIRLYRNGALVAVGDADDSFLGWGMDHSEFVKNPQLNTLAIVEYIYEFVHLYETMMSHLPKVKQLKFSVGIKNVGTWEGKKLLLVPVSVNDLFYRSAYASSQAIAVTKDFTDTIPVTLTDGVYDSRYIAYQILSELCIHFGISPDKMPYIAKDEHGKFHIDIDKITEKNK